MTDSRLARWRRRWPVGWAHESGRLEVLELGGRAAGFLLKCGRTSTDNRGMRHHHTTVYALDRGAREIRCTCDFTKTPPAGTPMAELERAARAHARSAILEEELTAMERQDRRVFGRID